MVGPSTHFVRKYATEARVNGVKRLIYVGSCSCGERHQGSKSGRDKWAETHSQL